MLQGELFRNLLDFPDRLCYYTGESMMSSQTGKIVPDPEGSSHRHTSGARRLASCCLILLDAVVQLAESDPEYPLDGETLYNILKSELEEVARGR